MSATSTVIISREFVSEKNEAMCLEIETKCKLKSALFSKEFPNGIPADFDIDIKGIFVDGKKLDKAVENFIISLIGKDVISSEALSHLEACR